MAIISNAKDSKMKLVFNAGVDENNKKISKSKTYSNIKPAVSNETMYNLGSAFSNLQIHTLTNIIRHEEFELINEIED